MTQQYPSKRTRAALCALMFFCALGLVGAEAVASGPADRLGLSGRFTLLVGDSGKCLAKAGGAKMGQQFHAWGCSKSGLQRFVLKERERGWYQIETASGRMCLDVSGNATKDGAPVVQWSCKGRGNANQLWQIIPDGGSKHFQLRVRHSGLCLYLDNIDDKVTNFVQRACKQRDPAQSFTAGK